MIGLYVEFQLKDQASALAFDELTSRLLPSIETNEPGTLTYDVHHSVEEPLKRVFYEVYQDEAAFGAHEARPEVKEFLEKRAELLAGFTVSRLRLAQAIRRS